VIQAVLKRAVSRLGDGKKGKARYQKVNTIENNTVAKLIDAFK